MNLYKISEENDPCFGHLRPAKAFSESSGKEVNKGK